MCIEPGDRVLLDYVGRLEDGTVFATSDPPGAEIRGPESTGEDGGSDPLSFTVGRNEIIDGLDEAVVGMSVDEDATVTVPPEDGYGEYDAERVRKYNVDKFEAMVGRKPEIGLHVEARNDLHGDVTAIVGDTVEVDFNHELAGKTLVFDVRIRDVV